MKKKKHWFVLASACTALAVTTAAAFNDALATRAYSVKSDKVAGPIRLALLTDLHCCDYGEGQRELLDAVEAQHPDLVLLGGDIVDDGDSLPDENAWMVVAALAEGYPTFYVTGNHEYLDGRAEEIKSRMRSCGVTVLEGSCSTVLFQGQPVTICGVDDPLVGERAWSEQLKRASSEAGRAYFTVLLTHRPERVEAYRKGSFDLILAGHAHGGQWRVPMLLNGLLAPNQGLFPEYAGGAYALGSSTMVVSRGLARESTRVPRIFNRPELVIIDVLPGD